ncbi:MAG: hypothetical protein AB7T27_02950 [Kiritimatiellia bacterium]
MKFGDMTKEQKQKVVLAGMGAAALLYVLYQFVLVPGIGTAGKSKDELAVLQADMEKVNHTLSSGTRLRGELEASAARLKEDNSKHIVPSDNPLAWALERVYECAEPLGIEIASVSPVTGSPVPWERTAGATRLFNPYTVKVVTRCGYFTLVSFLQALESANPYVCVSDLRIRGTLDNLAHDVEFMLVWPKWADEKSKESIRGLDGKPAIVPADGI